LPKKALLSFTILHLLHRFAIADHKKWEIERVVCVFLKNGPKQPKNPSEPFRILQGPSYSGKKLKG
jgi:hypothetical protein